MYKPYLRYMDGAGHMAANWQPASCWAGTLSWPTTVRKPCSRDTSGAFSLLMPLGTAVTAKKIVV